MLQKYNRWNVLRAFFDDPNPEAPLQLREISRKAKLAPPSVSCYLAEFIKEGLITKSRHRLYGYPTYRAGRGNARFRFLKKMDVVLRMQDEKVGGKTLVEYLRDECMPDAIVLFGSASRGEDLAGSDVDLFLQCKPAELKELPKYESLLKRKVRILFMDDFRELSSELKNNIANGAILYGYLRAFSSGKLVSKSGS